jgi:hypothetical protein
MARVHPQLAAGPLDDPRGLAVVVRMSMRADQETDVHQAGVQRAERALELGHRVRAVEPAVDEHDAVGPLERPCVHMRDPRPWQRESQPPDPGFDLFAASA